MNTVTLTPFIWTASVGAANGRTLTCDWCGHVTDWLGSQMGNYAKVGWACRECMRYGFSAERDTGDAA